MEGFNMGVDFQAGLLQEIQFAPGAFRITYSGRGNASISLSRTNLTIVISGASVDEVQHDFPFASYPTVNDLVQGLQGIDGISASASAAGSVRASWLVVSAQSNPQLGSAPYNVHYLSPDEQVIPIEDVRSALLPLGTVSVQNLGDPAERRFMIRMEDSDIEGGQGVPAEKIIATLESAFGQGGVAVNKSDYVGSRFSKQLADQAGILLGLTLLLILIYSTIRFKPQYAIGAVLAIVHDALIMVAFVVWSRMEFNTTTIAAILTILGYSINDTIVIFDRVRESRRIYPEDTFVNVLDRAITETLSRTIITTFTTMLAVMSLFIFTTGSMKDFALALLVGMTSGVYSTIFIACGFVLLWENQRVKGAKKKLPAPSGAVPAKA
jgi:preprotein translocase subunit SecF